MREIKFRGKRVDTGEWIYGNLYIAGINKIAYIKENGSTYRNFDKNGFMWGYFIEVIPETVGQYTGIKDKNGVEIYERRYC